MLGNPVNSTSWFMTNLIEPVEKLLSISFYTVELQGGPKNGTRLMAP